MNDVLISGGNDEILDDIYWVFAVYEALFEVPQFNLPNSDLLDITLEVAENLK